MALEGGSRAKAALRSAQCVIPDVCCAVFPPLALAREASDFRIDASHSLELREHPVKLIAQLPAEANSVQLCSHALQPVVSPAGQRASWAEASGSECETQQPSFRMIFVLIFSCSGIVRGCKAIPVSKLPAWSQNQKETYATSSELPFRPPASDGACAAVCVTASPRLLFQSSSSQQICNVEMRHVRLFDGQDIWSNTGR